MTSATTAQINANKDFEVVNPPEDSISCLAFSPKANYLVAGSWDNQIRLWDVQPNGSTVPKMASNHEGPVLCAAWSADGGRVFSGGCDNKAKCWVLQTGQSMQIGQHSNPIKSVIWVEELQTLITGSWDRTIKYWDARTPNPVHTSNLPERLYTADAKYPLCVAESRKWSSSELILQ